MEKDKTSNNQKLKGGLWDAKQIPQQNNNDIAGSSNINNGMAVGQPITPQRKMVIQQQNPKSLLMAAFQQYRLACHTNTIADYQTSYDQYKFIVKNITGRNNDEVIGRAYYSMSIIDNTCLLRNGNKRANDSSRKTNLENAAMYFKDGSREKSIVNQDLYEIRGAVPITDPRGNP